MDTIVRIILQPDFKIVFFLFSNESKSRDQLADHVITDPSVVTKYWIANFVSKFGIKSSK